MSNTELAIVAAVFAGVVLLMRMFGRRRSAGGPLSSETTVSRQWLLEHQSEDQS
jgi:hypothetical protein